MREAGDAAGAWLVWIECPRTRMTKPAFPLDRARHDRIALGMRCADALLRASGGYDPVGKLGSRVASAGLDLDVCLERRAAELGEPRAELRDEVERKAIAAGRDRRTHAGVDAASLPGLEMRDLGALAVPD